MKNWLLALILVPTGLFSQVTGNVSDKSTKTPIYGAKIISSTGEKVLSDVDGNFELKSTSIPFSIVVLATTYFTDTILVTDLSPLKIKLDSEIQEIKTMVVTSGRRDQNIEEVPISMEIIRPELIANKGVANLEEAVDQSPGVYTMDGQVSIRGGSGFAYGAGSRVLLLWNGIPILSGDAGDAKWNAIPMESASQVEILKGASSVLYGSGALNGIISLTEREPGIKGETRVKIQAGVYDNPKRESLKWWTSSPMFYQGDAYYGKMFKNIGFTVSMNGYSNSGYKEGETEDRGRLSGSVFFRPEKFDKLKAGLSYNAQFQKTGNFIIWESDSLAYTPSGTADTSLATSTLTYNTGARISVDPYVKFYDKKNNLHTLKSRYYFVNNTNLTNTAQSSNAGVLYGDYQFQHKWDKNSVLTAGISGIRSEVKATLFGNHFSNNLALYGQYEQSIGKLDLTGGMRLEHFEQDRMQGDTYYYLNADSTSKLPVYPIFRLGAHYEVAKFSHLRASFGQGVRFPSVAERYTKTSVGALNVFPNAALTPETGWAAEIGFKQGVKIGENWKGLIDVAGFINQYSNMMEFTFGFFDPSTNQRLNPDSPTFNNQIVALIGKGYEITDMIGFGSENSEKARISGIEFSFNSIGEIGDVSITSLIGYTYMNPITLNNDTTYISTFSTYDETTGAYNNTLKYRFNHLVKGDVELKYKNASIGFSSRFASNMANIDKVFEDDIAGTTILPGLKEYRKTDNKGSLVFDARFGYEFLTNYRVGFIINNVFNREYSSRPGDIQAPRNFILQVQMKF